MRQREKARARKLPRYKRLDNKFLFDRTLAEKVPITKELPDGSVQVYYSFLALKVIIHRDLIEHF